MTTSERARLGRAPNRSEFIDGAWRLPGQRAVLSIGAKSPSTGVLGPSQRIVLSAPQRAALLLALGSHRPEHAASVTREFGITEAHAEQSWPLGARRTGALVLGQVERSDVGNTVLRFGAWLGHGWEQTHHVALSPSERETLIAMLTGPNTPPEELEAAAALLRDQADHLEAVARAWPAHNPHTSTPSAAQERRDALVAARAVLYEGVKGSMVEADPPDAG